MSGFRSHRSRFRREKLTDQANNQEQNSVFSSSLGKDTEAFRTLVESLEQMTTFISRIFFEIG